jgi:DNA-binding NarL/FixJ family response regulator
MSTMSDRLKSFNLTAREIDTIELAIQGFSNEEIADRLSSTESEIKLSMSSIYSKLGVASRVQLYVKWMPYMGFVEPSQPESEHHPAHCDCLLHEPVRGER